MPSAADELHDELGGVPVSKALGIGVGPDGCAGIPVSGGAGLAVENGVDGVLEDRRALEPPGGHGVSFPLPVDKIISPGNYLKAHGYFQIYRKVFQLI